jgi:hypothetical protein
MLNGVLEMLEQRGVFTQMGPEAARQFVLEVLALSCHYDCNQGEILDGIGARLGICEGCLGESSDLVGGFCASCRDVNPT